MEFFDIKFDETFLSAKVVVWFSGPKCHESSKKTLQENKIEKKQTLKTNTKFFDK